MPLSYEQTLEMQQRLRVLRARADEVFQAWGERAPAPVASCDENYASRYRRKLVRLAQARLPNDHELRRVPIAELGGTIFKNFEGQIYEACKAAATRPDAAAPGELREVVTINPQNGHKEINFIGTQSFVRQMGREGRRVVSFMHRYNTSGVAFR
jgi:hypothetical protein